MIAASQWIVIAFGGFIIFVGVLMLFVPERARAILRKAASTNFINYAEITIRMIPATAMILFADYSKFPELFKIFGWIMIITSVVLFIVPRQMHHNYSLKAAEILTPGYVRLISPLAFALGAGIVYGVW